MTSTRAWAIAARYARSGKRQFALGGLVLGLGLGGGCAAPAASDAGRVVVSDRDWAWDRTPGREVATRHYRLLTTVRDAAVITRFARVMEAAHAGYAAVVGPGRGDVADKPLEVLLFAKPEEWEAYTKLLTGRDAPLYLSVGQGGYAYGDRFVCWLGSERDLWGVAAHEGFHQYVARHLAWRLPPALEEGLATTFENVSVGERSVTFDRDRNPRRQEGLAVAVRDETLLPLDALVRLHAGDIAGRDLATREAFYGQCWALAVLLERDVAYRAGTRRLFADLADASRPQPIGRTGAGGLYLPSAVRPLLQRTVAKDWTSFVAQYEATVHRLATATARQE